MKRHDLTGQKFGKLLALEYAGKDRNNLALWNCVCDCGTHKIVRPNDLRKGSVQSCGCLNKAQNQSGSRRFRHGLSRARIYWTWNHMRQRCNNPKNRDYRYYGERGIAVCQDWNKFEDFYTWAMASGYQDDLTIERKDVNGNYEPGNCTWIPLNEQYKNKRSPTIKSKPQEE